MGACRRQHYFCPLRIAGRRGARCRQVQAKEVGVGATAGGDFRFRAARRSALPAFSNLRRLPLPAHFGSRAIAAEDRDFARDALAAGRNSMEWADSGAFGGAVWVPEARAMGGA